MLKKDNNAGFTYTQKGFFIRRKLYSFSSGKFSLPEEISEKTYQSMMEIQNESPVPVMRFNSKVWWMFQDEFYWEDDNLDPEEVKALILARHHQKKRKIERAKAIVSQDVYLESNGRQPIPDDVKIFVWQRDGGRCVKCGSNQNLEYDHIIPVSQGGGNSARNLQILCEECNRSKGGNLV